MREDTLTKLQPGWKNSPSYQDLNNDVDGSSGIQEDIRDNLAHYKLIKDGGKKVSVKPGKSTVRPKLVRKQQEWKYPAMEEPFLNTPDMFEIKPRTFEDVEAARQNALLLNYQYGTKLNKTKLINTIVRTLVDEGTVIVKTGWEAVYETQEVEKEREVYASAEESLLLMQQAVDSGQMTPEEAEQMILDGTPMVVGMETYMEEEEVLVKNQPTHEVCDNANVGIDPKCEGDLDAAGFIWHEFDTTYAELIKNKYTEHDDGTTSGYYHNIDAAISKDSSVAYDEHKPTAYNDFVYSDKARKKRKAVEYWGFWDIQGDGVLVSIVAEWINGVLIRLEENPYPHKKLPFSTCVYMPVLRSTHGEPDAPILEDNQNTVGKMMRAAHDITSTAATGQEFIDNQFFGSPAEKNQYEKGNTVYFQSGFDPKKAIHRRTVDPIDRSIFQMIDINVGEAESLSGTKAFSGGMSGNALGSTATGIRSALDATSKRELSILRRLSDMFVDMARKVISMNQAYLDEEEVVRVTNDEFVTIRRDDLEGNFDLRVSVSTPEKDEEQAQKLMMLMQTNAANMDSKLYAMIMGQITRLQKMPDLAEQIETYEPEPDPAQVELQALQIENARLANEKIKMEMLGMQSIVHERATRGTENITADIANKLAQAELRAAQAEMNLALANKYASEGDAIDQEFLGVNDGTKRTEAIEDQEYNASVNHEQTMIKLQAEANAATVAQEASSTDTNTGAGK